MAPGIVLEPLSPPRDATYTVVADAVQDVINGRLSPATAAANIDAAIMSAERDDVWNPDCLNDDNKSDQGTEEEAERDGGLEGRRTVLLEFLATAAVQVPASHAGQDKLVGLLQEIPKLPYRHITMFDGNCGQDTKRGNLWAARHVENYQGYLKFVESSSFHYVALNSHANSFSQGLLATSRSGTAWGDTLIMDRTYPRQQVLHPRWRTSLPSRLVSSQQEFSQCKPGARSFERHSPQLITLNLCPKITMNMLAVRLSG
jgi:hypothetical protein